MITLNPKLMEDCDEFLGERVRKRELPRDFDDVTWVMHDFVLWLKERESQG